jgi:hypothetical protein
MLMARCRFPIDQVMNWVGGVTDPQAALDLIGQGGIPNIALVQGGVVKFVKMEHVWVEAWVDFIPSRGAKNKVGDSWVALVRHLNNINTVTAWTSRMPFLSK